MEWFFSISMGKVAIGIAYQLSGEKLIFHHITLASFILDNTWILVKGITNVRMTLMTLKYPNQSKTNQLTN